MRAGMVALLVLIAGCQETQHCGPGLYGSGCQFALSGERDSGRDGGPDGMDGGEDDAGADAFVSDAGPCGEMCPMDRPECYLGSDGGDAGQAAGCVECIADVDCRRADAGAADSGLLGQQYCVDFECTRGCRSDADCGPNACRPDGMCSVFPRASDVCMPCDTDANCASPLRCVMFANASHPGSYCLADVASFGACAGRRRFTVTLPATMSVDGASATQYCAPPAGATCEAVLDASMAAPVACTLPAMCGDGTGSCGSDGACTYPCSSSTPNECPSGQTCPSATSLCTR